MQCTISHDARVIDIRWLIVIFYYYIIPGEKPHPCLTSELEANQDSGMRNHLKKKHKFDKDTRDIYYVWRKRRPHLWTHSGRDPIAGMQDSLTRDSSTLVGYIDPRRLHRPSWATSKESEGGG
jgi:hypothetical protein